MLPSTTVGGWFARTVTSVEKSVSPTVSVTVRVKVTVWSAVAAAGAVHMVLAAEALAKLPPPLLFHAKVRAPFSGSATLAVSCTVLAAQHRLRLRRHGARRGLVGAHGERQR